MTLQEAVVESPPGTQTPWARNVTMIWLIGMFVLLPIDVVKLPLNVTLVDVWTIMALPFVWLSIPRGKQILSLYYMIPMLLILVGSFASTIGAPAPKNALVVLLKEIFAFVWFITLTIALVGLKARDFHRVLVVWSMVALVHGMVIIAQFISPNLWQVTAEHLGRGEGHEIYRPSGLIANANGAAFFQLLGFVPFLLVRFPRKTGVALGLILLSTMLATGSMAAMLSFTAGSMVALTVLAMKGYITVFAKLVARLAIAAAFFGAVIFPVISENERYQVHLQRILLGRAERSSESRFDLWSRGMDVFLDKNVFLWGVGPENFRVVDGNDNQLHNDFLAFLVERGLIGTLGLGLFALLALIRSVNLFQLSHSQGGDGYRLVAIVFLFAMTATVVYSLTHQVFHNRQLWIVLAFQEAMYFRLTQSAIRLEMPRVTLKTLSGNKRSRYPIGSHTTGT